MPKKNSGYVPNTFFHWNMTDAPGDVFQKNEIQANWTTAISLFASVMMLLVILVLGWLEVFNIDYVDMQLLLIVGIVLLLPAILCFVYRGQGTWIKYMLIVSFLLGSSVTYVIFGNTVLLLMFIPLLASCRYYSNRLYTITAISTAFLLACSTILSVAYGTLDLNAVFFKEDAFLHLQASQQLSKAIYESFSSEELLRQMLLYSYLPILMLSFIIFIVCYLFTSKGKEMIEEEFRIANNTSRISSELALATQIQADMLPNVFPPFPDHVEFDIYASMTPAKEVGGDFYDFFMIDDTHVAIIVGDVSGKGVPAALFMVTTKTLLRDHSQLGLTPAEVFTRVNNLLCETNKAEFFVTAWMGIIDIKNGKLTYVNAGHNQPLIKHKNGSYEFLSKRTGFVLAGIEHSRYQQAEMDIVEGDRLFLYTDGVTETTSNKKELFGNDRLREFLNNQNDAPIKELTDNLLRSLNAFSYGTEQFDDITMLIFEYKEATNKNIVDKIFPAKINELDNVINFVSNLLENANVDNKTIYKFNICVEEIFVNIAHYAYPKRSGVATISVLIENDSIVISFKDSGIPFNPLSKDDPDITLSSEERPIGGLGIFMVKKMVDDMYYEYKDSMNILTIRKLIKG